MAASDRILAVSDYALPGKVEEAEPLLQQEKAVKLVALPVITARQQSLGATLSTHTIGLFDKLRSSDFNPASKEDQGIALETFSKITEQASEIRKEHQVNAWHKDSRSLLTGAPALVGADAFQMGFGGINTALDLVNVIKPGKLSTQTPLTTGLKIGVGACEIGSGAALSLTGLVEIKSAMEDLKASSSRPSNQKLQNLEIFKVSKTYQKLRLAMGWSDLICGLLIIAIGIMTVVMIFNPFMPAWVLSLLLISVLLVPSIAPLVELSMKVYACHQKTDIGHNVEMEKLLAVIEGFENTPKAQKDLALQLAKSMLVMFGRDKDSPQFSALIRAKDATEVRRIFYEIMGQYTEEEMCQMTSKALEYLKSRVGEPAAQNLIASFKPMLEMFNKVTDPNAASNADLIAQIKNSELKNKINVIKGFIRQWNIAIHIRLAVQILYVISFFVSILCTLGTAGLALPWLQAAAPYLTALQDSLIFAAGAIPLLQDLLWRWFRGATLVADSVEMQVMGTKKLSDENEEIKNMCNELKAKIQLPTVTSIDSNHENVPIDVELTRIGERINTFENMLIHLDWLIEIEKDEQRRAELLKIINERYNLELYLLQIKQLRMLEQMLEAAKNNLNLDKEQKKEITETLEKVRQNVIKLTEARHAKIEELKKEVDILTERGIAKVVKVVAENETVRQLKDALGSAHVVVNPLLAGSMDYFLNLGQSILQEAQ